MHLHLLELRLSKLLHFHHSYGLSSLQNVHCVHSELCFQYLLQYVLKTILFSIQSHTNIWHTHIWLNANTHIHTRNSPSHTLKLTLSIYDNIHIAHTRTHTNSVHTSSLLNASPVSNWVASSPVLKILSPSLLNNGLLRLRCRRVNGKIYLICSHIWTIPILQYIYSHADVE